MELVCGATRAVFDPTCGGRLASLRFEGAEVLVTEGSSDTEWGGYPMAPWAGRVREGRFCWAGQDRQLPQNLPPHALHGTVFGAPWTVSGEGQMWCPLGPEWPWAGEVRSVVSVESDRLCWQLEVHAEAEPFPAVLGWHPWFRRRLADGATATLDFQPASMLERDAAGIPTGRRVSPTQGPWDDCFPEIHASPKLTWSNGLAVEVSSSCSHWVVYDEPEHAVCIEPQSGPPDAFNLDGAVVVRPGRPLVQTMVIRMLK